VRVFAPDGELLARIPVPERVGNLYIAATSSLYRIKTVTGNARRPAAP
jgi:sugar lactone lactonase YvrE